MSDALHLLDELWPAPKINYEAVPHIGDEFDVYPWEDIFEDQWIENPAYKMSLTEFSKQVLGHTNVCAMHKDWDQILEDTNKQWVTILAPPEHGKSVRVGINWALYELLKNPELRILNCTAVQGQSERQVASVFSYFNQYFPEKKGDKEGDSWGSRKFTLKREGIYQEASYTAMGLSSSEVLGGHWDRIIADDLCTQANTLTPLMRGRTAEFFQRTLMGRLAPGGKMVVIGSRWHPEDFYYMILEGHAGLVEYFNGPNGAVRVYRAIKCKRDAENKEILPLEWDLSLPELERLSWPTIHPDDGGWTWKEIMARWAIMGSLNAQLQLQNNPQITEGTYLKAKWLTDHEYTVDEFPRFDKLREGVVAIDPAFSTEEPGDWCAIGWGVRDYTGKVWLHDVQHYHVVWTDFVTQYLSEYYYGISEKLRKAIPWRILVEVNSFGGTKEFEANIRFLQSLGVISNLPMVAHTTSSSKEARIGTRSALFENGTVRVNSLLARAGHPYYDEWVGFNTAAHDDCLDVGDLIVMHLMRAFGAQATRAPTPRDIRTPTGPQSRRPRRRRRKP